MSVEQEPLTRMGCVSAGITNAIAPNLQNAHVHKWEAKPRWGRKVKVCKAGRVCVKGAFIITWGMAPWRRPHRVHCDRTSWWCTPSIHPCQCHSSPRWTGSHCRHSHLHTQNTHSVIIRLQNHCKVALGTKASGAASPHAMVFWSKPISIFDMGSESRLSGSHPQNCYKQT